MPGDPYLAYGQAQARVQHLERELHALDNCEGGGVLRGTPLGEAAMARNRVLAEWGRCLDQAEHAGLRERHQLHRQATKAAKREAPLRDAFEALAGPERARIRAELPEARKELGLLEAQREAASKFHRAHPEALPRLMRLGREIDDAAYDMDLEREPLDGIAPARLELAQTPWAPEPEVRVLERDIGLELGL